jgi:hypothetical protein
MATHSSVLSLTRVSLPVFISRNEKREIPITKWVDESTWGFLMGKLMGTSMDLFLSISGSLYIFEKSKVVLKNFIESGL